MPSTAANPGSSRDNNSNNNAAAGSSGTSNPPIGGGGTTGGGAAATVAGGAGRSPFPVTRSRPNLRSSAAAAAPSSGAAASTSSTAAGMIGSSGGGGGGRGGGIGSSGGGLQIDSSSMEMSLNSSTTDTSGNVTNNTMTTNNTSAATAATSPFLQGLMRFSPGGGASSSTSGGGGTMHHHHHHAQQQISGTTQHHPSSTTSSAGHYHYWSPQNRTTGGGSGRPQRARFFDTQNLQPQLQAHQPTTMAAAVATLAAATNTAGNTTTQTGVGDHAQHHQHHHQNKQQTMTGGGGKSSSLQQQQQPLRNTTNATDSNTAAAMETESTTAGQGGGGGAANSNVVDGIPLDHLRSLATQTSLLLECPHQALFYAGVLYAKTNTRSDARILAQALLSSGQYAACLQILDESGLLLAAPATDGERDDDCDDDGDDDSSSSWNALLIAAAALAATEDWTRLAEMLEDACRLPDPANNAATGTSLTSSGALVVPPSSGGISSFRHHFAGNSGSSRQQPLEDDDDIGWDQLKQAIIVAQAGRRRRRYCRDGVGGGRGASDATLNIHPLARICWWRGRAYQEQGNGNRASLFWKRALRIDGRCQAAWESLLRRHLLTAREAFDLVQSLDLFQNSGGSGSGSSSGGSNKGRGGNNGGSGGGGNHSSSASDMEWLRALYLARIELTPQDRTLLGSNAALQQQQQQQAPGVGGNNNSKPQQDSSLLLSSTRNKAGASTGTPSSSSFALHGIANLDASSIPMTLSPMPTFTTPNVAVSNAGHHAVSGVKDDSSSNNNNKSVLVLAATSHLEQEVDRAFDRLWNEHKLCHSPAVLAMAARRAYRRYDWKSALRYCQQLALLLQEDAGGGVSSEAAYCYVAALVVLGHARVLFRVAHAWVDAAPKSAAAWFAVGGYYYACERYHVAQRHFCRATRLDPGSTAAWIAFGCSFAACDESDQALASFRAAQRLSPGEHTSLLYMGMEYVRTNHLVLAHYFLQSALSASGGDPLALHELGVLSLQKGEHAEAIPWFQRALAAAVLGGASGGGNSNPNKENAAGTAATATATAATTSIEDMIDACSDPYWEPTLFNLGHCYRKTRQWEAAQRCFLRCVALCPSKYSTYAAYAFSKHLQGDLDAAIDYYHQALGCKPDDPFSTEMLNRALQEALSSGSGSSTYSQRSNMAPDPAPVSVVSAHRKGPLFLSPATSSSVQWSSASTRRDESMMSEEMESDVDMSGMS